MATLQRVGEAGKEVATADDTPAKERNFLGSGMSLEELSQTGDDGQGNAITPAMKTETDQMVTALLR
jgi:hypothetical protein